MKYSGIDLHSNNSVVVVTNEQDTVLEEKRVPNDLAAPPTAVINPARSELARHFLIFRATYQSNRREIRTSSMQASASWGFLEIALLYALAAFVGQKSRKSLSCRAMANKDTSARLR